MTVRTIVEFRTRPGAAERFERAYREGRMLERATTNPGFLRGELLRSVDDPGVFFATAEWRALDDYRAWQAAYSELPQEPLREMLEALSEPATTRIADVLLEADRDTRVEPEA